MVTNLCFDNCVMKHIEARIKRMLTYEPNVLNDIYFNDFDNKNNNSLNNNNNYHKRKLFLIEASTL